MTLRMMALRIPRLVGNSTFDVPRFMRGSEPRIRSFKPRESVGRPVTGRYLGSNAQPSAKTPQNTPPPFGPRDAGPFSWRMLAVFLGVGTGGLAYYSLEKQRRLKELTTTKSIGKAAIGGPFNLVDAHGKAFTDANLLGRWTLIYFGFTMCPDICPDELTKVSEALDSLMERGKRISSKPDADITPILISVDPERDSPARTQEYATGFHSAFVGLSGSLDQVKDAAKAYRVYYSKDETPGDEYLVDHSIITYLMDPEGNFADFYPKNVGAPEIVSRIEMKMQAWRPSNPPP